MIMVIVIVIYYWLTITINDRDTKCKTKKETYGCPLISLGYRILLLIAEKVYQMTVESQSRRVSAMSMESLSAQWMHFQTISFPHRTAALNVLFPRDACLASPVLPPVTKGPFWKWWF